MTLHEVLELGDPRLRQVSQDVPESAFGAAELAILIDDLIETMRQRNGAGIAAPQIGVLQRVCVIEVNDNPRYPYKPSIPLTVLINPQITLLGDEKISVIEGCLSVPNLRGRLTRSARVMVQARGPDGGALTLHAEGLTAATLQHEIDHLDGRLFVDGVSDSESLCSWASYARYHAQSFAAEAAQINALYPKPLAIEASPQA